MTWREDSERFRTVIASHLCLSRSFELSTFAISHQVSVFDEFFYKIWSNRSPYEKAFIHFEAADFHVVCLWKNKQILASIFSMHPAKFMRLFSKMNSCSFHLIVTLLFIWINFGTDPTAFFSRLHQGFFSIFTARLLQSRMCKWYYLLFVLASCNQQIVIMTAKDCF